MLIAAMALKQWSGLKVASLRTIPKITDCATPRVFIMIKSLAIEAVETGEERITDETVQSWQPIWAKHAWTIPRQLMAEFGPDADRQALLMRADAIGKPESCAMR